MPDEVIAAVDRELYGFLDDRRRHSDARLLIDEIVRILQAGGKRLRPSFCYWAYRASEGRDCDDIVRAAASLELLHTFALIHDDIMDRSAHRRGVTSVHAAHGVDVAILVGDLALVLADSMFMTSGFDANSIQRAFRPYSQMREEVIAGQFLDLEAATEDVVTEEAVRRVAVLKSGRYSVEKPLAIGASLAGASPLLLSGFSAFGEPLGEAFQLRDDLLGTFGDPATTGKPADSDIREGKKNVLYAKGVAALAGEERAWFTARWGRGSDLSDEDVARLRSLLEASGGRAATEELLGGLLRDATDALDALDIDDRARDALRELAGRAAYRSA